VSRPRSAEPARAALTRDKRSRKISVGASVMRIITPTPEMRVQERTGATK
jgi:hypothetical protein